MKFSLCATPRKSGAKKYWYYQYLDEAGFRVRKTTKCTKKIDAQAFVDELNKQAEKEKIANCAKKFFDVIYWRDFCRAKQQRPARIGSIGAKKQPLGFIFYSDIFITIFFEFGHYLFFYF
jgi:hypothetical protein